MRSLEFILLLSYLSDGDAPSLTARTVYGFHNAPDRNGFFTGTGTGVGTGAPLRRTTFSDAAPARDVALPIRIYNPRGEAMTDVRVTLSSEYPTVRLLSAAKTVERIESGAVADLSGAFKARFTAGAGVSYDFEGTQVTFDYGYRSVKYFDGNHVISIKLGF